MLICLSFYIDLQYFYYFLSGNVQYSLMLLFCTDQRRKLGPVLFHRLSKITDSNRITDW
jgi:hypothetical protein